MSVLFRRLFRTYIFSRFSKVATATSNFMNEFYNGGFAPEFSVSMLKETIALVRDYVSETRKLCNWQNSWKIFQIWLAYELLPTNYCSYYLFVLDSFFTLFLWWRRCKLVTVIFDFVLFFKPISNKLIIMIITINITIIDIYPLKQLISRKVKLLEMNIYNKLKFAHAL